MKLKSEFKSEEEYLNYKKSCMTKITDLRTVSDYNFLAPYNAIIPEGVSNTLVDIESDGEIIGNLEIGTDGFVQGIFVINNNLIKIFKYPKDKKASIISLH